MHAVIQQHIPHSSQNPDSAQIHDWTNSAKLCRTRPGDSLRGIVHQFAWDADEEQDARMDFTQERVTRFLCINCIIIVYTKLA